MKLSNKVILALLGIGALCVYAYNQLSDEDKLAIKEKGIKILDDLISPLVATALGVVDDVAAKVEQV